MNLAQDLEFTRENLFEIRRNMNFNKIKLSIMKIDSVKKVEATRNWIKLFRKSFHSHIGSKELESLLCIKNVELLKSKC